MSGLEVVGAIASIIELVKFSQQVLVRVAELRTNGKDGGEAFLRINDLLPPINHAVKRTKERIENREIDEETCASLIPIHRGVERTLKELQTILQKFIPGDGASKFEVFWKAGRSVFQEKKLKGVLQRLHEYVGVLTLSHAEAANAGNLSLIEKFKIQQTLANISHSITAPAESSRKCRNLLSLDGGGLRGLSILYILQDLMAKVNKSQDPPLKPCEVFDLIGGSGTGGLIAIMLGRLGMTVDECLEGYRDFFERLYTEYARISEVESPSSPIIKADVLRSAVLGLVTKRGLEPTSMLRNDDNVSCYTFVCATAEKGNTIVHLRNYLLAGEVDMGPTTIVEAVCATLASVNIFEAVEFGRPASKYIAGDFGANNPINRVWNEAQRIWSKRGRLDQLVSCVISVGAGSPLPPATTDRPGFTDTMYEIATQAEETAKKFLLGKRELGGRGKPYHRFNVNNLHEFGWERDSDSEVVMKKAIDYLEHCVEEIEQCAEYLQRDDVPTNARETRKYYEVDRTLVRNFIVREEILSEIDRYFSTDNMNCPKVLVLHALGGQGKSQTALKYCQKSRETHQGIFWINASSEITAREAFERIATVLDGKYPSGLGDLDQKIQHVLRTLERWEMPWVLVFDNYDSPEGFDVRKYFPKSGPGEILITSRNQNLGRFGERLEVPPMSSDEGLKLLLPDPAQREKSKDEGMRIIDRLGGLPLAIDQAAAYIDDTGMAIEDFLPTYEAERKRILGYTPDYGWEYRTMQLDGKAEEDKALSAFTTWNMSFQRLFPDDPEKQKKAAHFLTVQAFLDYLNVAEDLFQTFWQEKPSPPEWLTIFVGPTEDSDGDSLSSEHDFSSDDDSSAGSHLPDGQSRRSSPSNDIVQKDSKAHSQNTHTKNEWKSTLFLDLRVKCRHLSLLRIQSDSDQADRKYQTFSLHPLIRDWLQLQVRKNEQRGYFQEAIDIVSVSVQSFKNRNTTAGQKKALLANMDACMSNDKRFSKDGKALRYIESYTATIFANMYWSQGRLKEAEELEMQVMETSLKVLGLEHPDTLTRIHNIASTFKDQGRWKEAEELEVQVIGTMERVLGPEHPDTLTGIANLVLIFRDQGRWKEAEELYIQVIGTMERVLGPEHPDTLTSIANLALIFRDQGRWKEAEELGVQVIETRKRVLWQEHPSTLTSINNLAMTFGNQGRWKEAEELYIQVRETSERVLGPEHPSTLTSINNLASTLYDQGRWKEAEELEVQVLETSKRVLGPEHPNILTSMNNLASMFRNQGRWKEAEELEVQVTEARKRVQGQEHPDTLTSVGNLASTLRNQGCWKEAEELEVQVLETRKRVLGPEHPDTLTSIANLASTFRNQGRWKEAEELEVQVLETSKRLLGQEHPNTLTSMNNLAWTWKGQNRDAEALDLISSCLELLKKKLGANHPHTLVCSKTYNTWRME